MATLVGSGVDLGDGFMSWTNPGNVTADDGSSATNALTGGTSNTLRCTMAANAFSISSAATGILLEIKCSKPVGNTTSFALVRLVQGGTAVGTDQSASTALPTTMSYVSFGGSTSTWGNGGPIAAATVNSSTFGVDIQVSGSVTDNASIDAVRLTVTSSGGATESSELIISRMCICG